MRDALIMLAALAFVPVFWGVAAIATALALVASVILGKWEFVREVR